MEAQNQSLEARMKSALEGIYPHLERRWKAAGSPASATEQCLWDIERIRQGTLSPSRSIADVLVEAVDLLESWIAEGSPISVAERFRLSYAKACLHPTEKVAALQNGAVVIVRRAYPFIADVDELGVIVDAPEDSACNPGTQLLVTTRGFVAVELGDVEPTGRIVPEASLNFVAEAMARNDKSFTAMISGPVVEAAAVSVIPDELEIRKVLVLSTHHLTKDTCLGYKAWPFISEYEEGCYFYVGDEPELYTEAPDELRAVLLFAKKHGCTEVKFDRDAEVLTQLPWFDW